MNYSPIEPNPKKPDDLPVGRIITIVVLFSIGLWPVAVYLIWKTYTEFKKPQRRILPKGTQRSGQGEIYGEYRPYHRPTPPTAGAPRPQPNTAPTPAPQPAAAQKPAVPAHGRPWWHTVLAALGIVLLSAGSLLSFLALGKILSSRMLSDAVGMFSVAVPAVLSGVACFMLPRSLALQDAKKIRFKNVVGIRKLMPLPDMAATLGMPYPQLVKELQRFLDKGLFSGGYIDHARKLLVVSAEGLTSEMLADEFKQDKPQPDSRSGMLTRIRAVNDRIENVTVTQKVRRIEETTALILDAAGRDAAKERKIGAFMGYYLPTTLKILTAYEQFEEQGIQGENLQAAMRDIENILDHLVSGFERQLDLLFENDVLDISSDISVLESMLAKDGLTDDDWTMPKG